MVKVIDLPAVIAYLQALYIVCNDRGSYIFARWPLACRGIAHAQHRIWRRWHIELFGNDSGTIA